MKKIYSLPEAEMMLLFAEDIITDSDDIKDDIFDDDTDSSVDSGNDNDDVIVDPFTPV